MVFLKEFLKNTKQIVPIHPLSNRVSGRFDKNVNVIVELGAGTGVFTEMLVNNLNTNTNS